MAAIDTIHTFGGTGLGGFVVTEGAFSEVGGSCVPNDFSIDNTIIWDTSFPQTTTPTEGLAAKWTLSGGCEVGTVFHFIFDRTGPNDYRYARLVIGGITVFSDLKQDEITVWDVTGGVVTPIAGFTPTRDWQHSPGDMRHYRIVDGSAVSVHKWSNQLVVKFTAHDSIHGYDWNTDIIHITEKVTQKTTNGKIGWTSKGGSHTTAVSLLQAEVFTVYYMSEAGNDGNSGAESAPFRTFSKLVTTVGLKQVGVVVGGTYTESFGTGQGAPFNLTMVNGTSYEDAPTYMQKIGDNVIQKANHSSGCISFKSTNSNRLRWNVFFGWEVDANIARGAGTGADCAKVWGQFTGGTNRQNQYIRFQSMEGHSNIGGANFSAQPEVYYDAGNPTYDDPPIESDYYTYIHYLDINSHDSTDWPIPTEPYPGGTAPHGFYFGQSYLTVEYTQANDNYGDGGKFFEGTPFGPYGLGVYPSNYCVLRFTTCLRNRLYGWILSRGTDNKAYACEFGDCGRGNWNNYNDGQQAGVAMLGQSVNGLVVNSIAYGNLSAGFSVEAAQNTQQTINSKFVGCTAYNNYGNYRLQMTPGNDAIDTVTYINCSSHNPTFAHLWIGYNTPATIIKTNCHQTSGSDFGTTTGDPLFVDQASGDFHLQAGSPLIGAGADISSYTTVDYDQRTRLTNDIGAFWYPGNLVALSRTDMFRVGVSESGDASSISLPSTEETILQHNIGSGGVFPSHKPRTIYWFNNIALDDPQEAIPLVTIKISPDNESTFETILTDVPNVAGWNSISVIFKSNTANYRILIHDKNRPDVLSRGPGVFTVQPFVETVGMV